MPSDRPPHSLLQAALAPDLPDDLEAVLGKLNTYCQCMHGAAGAVAGCGPHSSPIICHPIMPLSRACLRLVLEAGRGQRTARSRLRVLGLGFRGVAA